VRCLADAEGILQTAFLRFVERRELLRGDDMALPWFRGILANATADHFRRRAALARRCGAWRPSRASPLRFRIHRRPSRRRRR
jgi:DNA-directed RNA polymerase specialized sigma24 family protein